MSKAKSKSKLGRFISKAESEIDDLREKISLGKMNGSDLFEEMKLELNVSFHNILKELNQTEEEFTCNVMTLIKELQEQLSLGKAEALTVYEEQKNKINKVITDIEENIRDTRSTLPYDLRLKIQGELEKFSLKMEILQIRYELGRLDLKGSVETKHEQFKKEFENLIENVKEDTSDQLEQVGNSLHVAYDSLRKSLQQ